MTDRGAGRGTGLLCRPDSIVSCGYVAFIIDLLLSDIFDILCNSFVFFKFLSVKTLELFAVVFFCLFWSSSLGS